MLVLHEPYFKGKSTSLQSISVNFHLAREPFMTNFYLWFSPAPTVDILISFSRAHITQCVYNTAWHLAEVCVKFFICSCFHGTGSNPTPCKHTKNLWEKNVIFHLYEKQQALSWHIIIRVTAFSVCAHKTSDKCLCRVAFVLFFPRTCSFPAFDDLLP